MKPRVKLRADGSSSMGLGHLFRMIAFSEILEKDFECSFIVKNPDADLIQLIEKTQCKLHILKNSDLDQPGVNEKLEDPIQKLDILVLDGYHFDTAYQEAVKKYIGCKLVCIDDIIAFPFVSDIVINHAGGIDKDRYLRSPQTQLVLGPKYAILRKEFYHPPKDRKNRTFTERVFINFGGADPGNFTFKILTDLVIHPGLFKSIDVVVGAAYSHHKELLEEIKEYDFIKVHRNLDVHQMIDLMQQADVAICSASTVAYEYCCISGLLFIVQTAANQSQLFNFLIDEGFALNYEHFFDTIKGAVVAKRNEMIARQKKTFDGLAGLRLRKELVKLYLTNNYFIRKAKPEDVDIYYEWANDPEVRKNSFNSELISFQEHCSWFNANLQSEQSCLYIVCSNQHIPIGSIRFKIEGDSALLSYLIGERFRGTGFGKTVLSEGIEQFFLEKRDVKQVMGFVKEDNIPSIRAFESSGFQAMETSELNSKGFFKTNKYE